MPPAPTVSPAPPYHSQWESEQLIPALLAGTARAREDPRWACSGARTPEEYEFWSWRVCGMACLKSILEQRTGSTPGTVTLAHELLLTGGYTLRPDGVRGLVYAPFADYLRGRWQIPAEVAAELDMGGLLQALAAGRQAVVSVHPAIRDAPAPPPTRGGHLVLAFAAGPSTITFHNPSGSTEHTRRAVSLPVDTFAGYFAGRGVLIG